MVELKERLAREKEEREKAEARAHVLAFSGREAHRQTTFAGDGEAEPAMDEQEARARAETSLLPQLVAFVRRAGLRSPCRRR